MDNNKKVRYALSDLYGIGNFSANKICDELNIPENLKIESLTEEQQYNIARKVKEEYRLESNLREEVKGNIQRYITNGSIRGYRHRHKLPVRGQRTHTNARTPRRVIMGMAIKFKKK